MKIIATKSKEKLPKGFSYPIGAERLSEELATAPHLQDFVLWFRWRAVYRASKYRNILENKGKITIIEVRYKSMFDEWRIDIYAVPAGQSAEVKALLNNEVFDDLRSKLKNQQKDFFSWKAQFSLSGQTVEIIS